MREKIAELSIDISSPYIPICIYSRYTFDVLKMKKNRRNQKRYVTTWLFSKIYLRSYNFLSKNLYLKSASLRCNTPTLMAAVGEFASVVAANRPPSPFTHSHLAAFKVTVKESKDGAFSVHNSFWSRFDPNTNKMCVLISKLDVSC